MHPPNVRPARDGGETLIETLLALMFVGLAISAVLGGVITASVLSDDHRRLTVADVSAKRAAETVKDLTYVPGACGDSPVLGCTPAGYGDVGLPNGYSLVVESVQCLSSSTATTVYDVSNQPACTLVNDSGLQLVSLVVTSSGGQVAERTQVMKRQS